MKKLFLWTLAVTFLIPLAAPCAAQKLLGTTLFAATIAYPFVAATLARVEVRDCIEKVLKGGGYGHLPLESAAFLVLNGDQFFCRQWPRNVSFRSQQWSGQLPDNTAAIIHSHPADLPDPSSHDRTLATRLGIPIFIVTPRGVTRADP